MAGGRLALQRAAELGDVEIDVRVGEQAAEAGQVQAERAARAGEVVPGARAAPLERAGGFAQAVDQLVDAGDRRGDRVERRRLQAQLDAQSWRPLIACSPG